MGSDPTGRLHDFLATLGGSVIDFHLQHRKATLEFFGTLARAVLRLEFGLEMSVNDKCIACRRQSGSRLAHAWMLEVKGLSLRFAPITMSLVNRSTPSQFATSHRKRHHPHRELTYAVSALAIQKSQHRALPGLAH